ncbi:hypothetical protein VQ03_19370 [Methylobacterium tarhaniae]|uniref:Uncharacterized protein n=1 Tax=Methylobacterium tarhaniae TaxID=1187852 RepID=A0A0J6SU58_9HYPH|nr:hypothetical protein [Methylobacterium tarhaniae]KMO37254.1 hypothetical protein VQ03_19370 [Methylobacterium tarhaniae]
MMPIGAALNAATTLVGGALPAGLIGQRAPMRRMHEAEESQETEESQAPPADGALLVAIEAGLREAGYLPA